MRQRLRIASALGCMLAACAAGAGAAEICKWIDRDGRVHYSDVPLADRPCVERIEIRHADAMERVRAEQRRVELQRRLLADDKAQEQAADAQGRAAAIREQRAARCAAARDELRFLQEAEGMRLLRPGDKDEGEPPMVWLDDAQRVALIDAWREQVRGWCESPSAQPAGAPPRAVAVPPPPRR